ncbi:MAG TPA: DUF456 domain-containing protein [Pontiella sp.]|nr:DUF456 domain-containing protein [Pontiella sp.]
MEVDWQALGTFGIYSLAALLCIIGFALSCLSLSGTWMVFGAALLVAWKRWPGFPGIGTLIVFLVLCVTAEIVEAFAGTWGVRKRGGSRAAGWAALGGGLLGMLIGTAIIPIPVAGSLTGMVIGSFGCAFLVEHAKMKQAEHAAHVATGAVLARLGVIFLKVGITVLMSLILAIGIAVS